MILISYGTRPEYIKIKSLVSELSQQEIPFKTLFTGQHKDLVDVESDFSVEIKEYGANRLDSIIQSLLNLDKAVLEGIDYVLVQGDTTSALALALTSINHGIKVIHLEAGLRTYDYENPFPEEYNRQLISRLALIHLCPTEENKRNLFNENIVDGVYVVGNTGLDGISHLVNKCYYGKKVLVTMHRRENHAEMDKWFFAIESLARKYPEFEFILPIHPNPDVKKHSHLLQSINLVDPLSREELLSVLVECSLVITDSGGLQEECSFFNKKCLVCRKITERPESLNKTSFIVNSHSDLLNVFSEHIRSPKVEEKCPFGDGKASEKIAEILKCL